MAVPTLTAQQRRDALAKALEARQARTKVLEGITAGTDTVTAVVRRAELDPVLGKTRLTLLLKAQPGWGTRRVEDLLDQLSIPPTRRVGGLGERQRQALLAALD